MHGVSETGSETEELRPEGTGRADPRELLTDGVVELRKRGHLATRRAGAESEKYLEFLARRAARRAGRPCAGPGGG
jgi:hypothetical protein